MHFQEVLSVFPVDMSQIKLNNVYFIPEAAHTSSVYKTVTVRGMID